MTVGLVSMTHGHRVRADVHNEADLPNRDMIIQCPNRGRISRLRIGDRLTDAVRVAPQSSVESHGISGELLELFSNNQR